MRRRDRVKSGPALYKAEHLTLVAVMRRDGVFDPILGKSPVRQRVAAVRTTACIVGLREGNALDSPVGT